MRAPRSRDSRGGLVNDGGPRFGETVLSCPHHRLVHSGSFATIPWRWLYRPRPSPGLARDGKPEGPCGVVRIGKPRGRCAALSMAAKPRPSGDLDGRAPPSFACGAAIFSRPRALQRPCGATQLTSASSLVKLPTHTPGGYSQWQSQTVVRREGKCRAPANNHFYNMISRPKISRKTDHRIFENLNSLSPNYENIVLRTSYYIVRLEY